MAKRAPGFVHETPLVYSGRLLCLFIHRKRKRKEKENQRGRRALKKSNFDSWVVSILAYGETTCAAASADEQEKD